MFRFRAKPVPDALLSRSEGINDLRSGVNRLHSR
jgi:hypothetical protein